MTTEVVRKAKPHQKYVLKSGEQVVGVTTALGVVNKPALVAWANNLGLQGIKQHEYVDDLADVGTCAHYLVHCDLASEKPDLQDFTPRQVDRAENALISYYAWSRGKAVTTQFSEEPLVSEEHRYGGTVDWYGELDGRWALVDIKTGKAIYDDYIYQTAAYHQLLVETGHPVDEIRILQVGRDETEGFSEKMIPAAAIGPYWEVFKSALGLYYAMRATKKGAK